MPTNRSQIRSVYGREVWNAPDRFGVPANTFGHVPEEFYGAVGRIVMLAAVLENTFASVVGFLEQEAESANSGQPVAALTKRFDQIAGDRKLPSALVETAAEMLVLLQQRNAIVHSLWPSPTLASARGWRGIVARKRDLPGNHIEWVEHDIETLTTLIGRLVAVDAALRDFLDGGELNAYVNNADER